MSKTSIEPRIFALFGAFGDLALRKLFPALYQLDRAELLSADTRIIALSRQTTDRTEAQALIKEKLVRHVAHPHINDLILERFVERIECLSIEFSKPSDFDSLAEKVGANTPIIAFFATPASVYGSICAGLASAGLAERCDVVLEKPIGHDLASFHEVSDAVSRYFPENRTYRIDHYLGKDTVQNLSALRFANNLFGSQWNQNHISHVEITVAETVGIEGRWGYFDQAGQLRDMIQNHLMQLLCLIAMDPPPDLSANSIRDEKVKVLKSLVPISSEKLKDNLVLGQYRAGNLQGTTVPGYLEEEGANSESTTETFVALRVEISNWRWIGVPFYLRTGKRMAKKLSEIVVHFKAPPHSIFLPEHGQIISNRLIIRLQPNEGISLSVMTTDRGLERGMQLRSEPLRLNFADSSANSRIPDAYERLLLEVMKGQQNLFVRKDEIECAWKWCDQLIANCKAQGISPDNYAAGSWGPEAAMKLMDRDGRSWHDDD
ncbi:glucose-6-phosphate dehydrogenase [Halopseudomonas salegens]|uniref:Glucose-6-phosphate 1-dehydrogenase n=1 Tax=Halopseudomonas salegens TaxID=1434072 RepID=A0A1H2E4X3_9GAMM|nr:glucose-6-phosphate dehydrogenase [Halopseudomonas salegens]SDT90084.1 glucose-6-phosphate 1-dehydrogenase [Halopseudomonas salegens]